MTQRRNKKLTHDGTGVPKKHTQKSPHTHTLLDAEVFVIHDLVECLAYDGRAVADRPH